ncbi:acyltransferase [Parasalinivibrio latis]|uniref:acyltransferase family protein n=1 Tax=Parasalinivibrio latis TaxID=2952610 RepID=UPI0030E55842
MDKTNSLSRWINKADALYDTGSTAARLLPMQGLRGIAAFMVFVVHYCAQILPWLDTSGFNGEAVKAYRAIGASGVDLFFVLSGFLIYGMLIKREQAFLPYFKRRIRRIYPTFLCVLAIYILLSAFFPGQSKFTGNMVTDAGLVLGNVLLLPGMFDMTAIISVAWSLSYEMFFYLSVPLAICVFNMRKWQRSQRVAFLAGVSFTGFFTLVIGYTSHSELLMFFSGMLLFEFIYGKEQVTSPLRLPVIPVVFLLLAWYRFSDAGEWVKIAVMFVGYALVCIQCLDESRLLSRICTSRFMLWFGNMSYSYYLIHGLTLKFLFMVLPFVVAPAAEWTYQLYLLLPLFFAATWISSTALYLIVEKPFSLKPVAPGTSLVRHIAGGKH